MRCTSGHNILPRNRYLRVCVRPVVGTGDTPPRFQPAMYSNRCGSVHCLYPFAMPNHNTALNLMLPYGLQGGMIMEVGLSTRFYTVWNDRITREPSASAPTGPD